MLLLVLLQVCDTLSIFSLLLMTNQVVFSQGEIITHFLQLLCKLLVFRQQRLSAKDKKKHQVNITLDNKRPLKVIKHIHINTQIHTKQTIKPHKGFSMWPGQPLSIWEQKHQNKGGETIQAQGGNMQNLL